MYLKTGSMVQSMNERMNSRKIPEYIEILLISHIMNVEYSSVDMHV
jgi:hypothetical protein